jgi:hypothetical protein
MQSIAGRTRESEKEAGRLLYRYRLIAALLTCLLLLTSLPCINKAAREAMSR